MPVLGKQLLDRIELPKHKEKKTFAQKLDTYKKVSKTLERLHLFEDKAFYTVIVFQSKDQVNAFCKAMGWENPESNHWLDGRVIAQIEGIKLPKVDEETLHRAYALRKLKIEWPDGLEFFDETKEI